MGQGIRDGFKDNTYFVRSLSCETPHIIKRLLSGSYVCDKQCQGYANRNICGHVLALALKKGDLVEYIAYYIKNFDGNITRLTTANIGKNPGQKKVGRKRARARSPDLATGTVCMDPPLLCDTPGGSNPPRLGDILDGGYNTEFVSQVSPGSMRLNISKKPMKPPYIETRNTEFYLVSIKRNIRKCIGCSGNLVDGVSEKHSYDEKICIRHKENEWIYVSPKNGNPHWKKTFDNKYYHVLSDCIKARNDSFDLSQLIIETESTITGSMKAFLQNRLDC